MSKRVLLTTTSFQDTPGTHQDLLNSQDWEIVRARGPLSEAEMLDLRRLRRLPLRRRRHHFRRHRQVTPPSPNHFQIRHRARQDRRRICDGEKAPCSLYSRCQSHHRCRTHLWSPSRHHQGHSIQRRRRAEWRMGCRMEKARRKRNHGQDHRNPRTRSHW